MSVIARLILPFLAFLLTLSVADDAHARKRLRGIAPKVVDALLFDEQKQIAQTCYWLRSSDTTWKPDNGLVLTRAGLTQLARDAYDPVLALLTAAQKDAAELAKSHTGTLNTYANQVASLCDPSKLLPDVRGLVATASAAAPGSKLAECAEALSKLEAELLPDTTSAIGKLVHALDESAGRAGAIADILRDPRALANQFDFSPRIVDLMVRLTQAAHDKLDGSAINNLPFGSGAAKWLIEIVMGELLGIMLDHQLWLLEDAEVASRADVSRRACDLLEQAASRPVITNRMLIRMVLRFVETEDAPPADETRRERRKRLRKARKGGPTMRPSSVCENYPLFCRRMSRRLGVRHPVDNKPLSIEKLQRAVVPTFEYIDAPRKPDLEEDPNDQRILDRAETTGGLLVKATGACVNKQQCTMEDINRAMSMLAVAERMPVGAPPVPEVFVEEEDCCCEEPASTPETLPLVPSPPGTVAILLDRSSTMTITKRGTGLSRWEHATAAIDTVLANMDTISVSPPTLLLGVFPDPSDRCSPGGLTSFTSATAALTWTSGLTPPYKPEKKVDLTPLASAIKVAAARLHGELHPAMIIVTDGKQEGCGSTQEDVIQAITDANADGILVYVIGIAGDNAYRRYWLAMAGAGGTRGHVPNNLTPDPHRISKAIDDALATHRCTVDVPREPKSIEVGGVPAVPGSWEYVNSVGRTQIRWTTDAACRAFLMPGVSATATYE